MRTWIPTPLCAATVAAVLGCALPTMAQDFLTYNVTVPTDGLTQLEKELAAPGSGVQQVSWQGLDCGGCGDCDSCQGGCGGCGNCGRGGCGGCCDWREAGTTPGLYVGFELVWVKPYFRNQSAYYIDYNQPDTIAVTSFDTNFDVTPRVWLGYTTDCGLGVRARYWQYDHSTPGKSAVSTSDYSLMAVCATDVFYGFASTNGVGQTLTATHGLELHTFDVEVTQDFNWWRTSVTLGAGVRYVKMQQDYTATIYGEAPIDMISLSHGFEGAGPTVAIDLRRRIRESPFYITAGARESILFVRAGQDMYEDYWGYGDHQSSICEEIRAITEIRLGVEYRRHMAYSSTLIVRGGYEGQIWHDAGGPNFDSGDLGLHGFSAGFAFIR